MKNSFKLSVIDIRLWVHLGCSEQEKFHPQMISISIDLCFCACPNGARSDNVEDTVCYAKLAELVTRLCQKKYFNIIENLSQNIFIGLEGFLLPYRSILESIKIEVHKLSPPVRNIHGGVSWVQCINFDKENL